MEIINDLYEKIPKKLRKPLFHWVLPFILGLIITSIWGIGTLFAIIIISFLVFYMIYNLVGNSKSKEISRWSITEYFKRIRGMIIFALLPTVWELVREVTLESIISLCILGIVVLSIWEKFDEVIKDVTVQLFGKKRRRRRYR